MKIRIRPYMENVAESGCSCLITMVQGNVLALTLSHWLVACETGFIAGTISASTAIAARFRKPWHLSLTLGVVTIAVDAFVHRATFGLPTLFEAVVTGLGAYGLSLAVQRASHALSRRSCTAPLPYLRFRERSDG